MISSVKFFAAASAVIACALFAFSQETQTHIETAKPWVVWHIMGGSLIESDIKADFDYMAKSGIGGACIVPIYAEKGDDKNCTEFLSENWMQKLRFINTQAKQRNLGVDMAMGTGWPFGGSNVSVDDSAKCLDKKGNVAPTNQKVKRAAPKSEGLVIDPFSKEAFANYAEPFYKAFNVSQNKKIIRAFFNDSYEVFGANWTKNFLEEFRTRRGYDFAPYKNILLTDDNRITDIDKRERLWQDYHATIADMLLENFTMEFTKAAHNLGFKSKNQAHGSPANLCDLYAASDIAETESFGSSAFEIPLVRVDKDYDEKAFGRPNKLMMKFASSAANTTSKKLVSSETGTWLGNHFKVALSQLKPQVDELFLGGINHIFWHGFTHSPQDKPFPGRLFYASTNFNANSHFKNYFSDLNSYVYESQKLLQSAVCDNDILLYFPIVEFWKQRGSETNVLMFDVHHASSWLKRCRSFENIAKQLDSNRYCFDYISDRQIQSLSVINGKIVTESGQQYSAVVIPKISQMPLGTYEKLILLAGRGAKIVFENDVPSDVEGLANLQMRKNKAEDFALQLKNYCEVGDALISLAKVGVHPEEIEGLQYIRKSLNGRAVYFTANLGAKTFDKYIKLRKSVNSIFDPLTKEYCALNTDSKGMFRLRLEAGQSCFLLDLESAPKRMKRFSDFKNAQTITGEWKIDFIKGNPELPSSAKMKNLVSWTTLPDHRAKYFSGTAKYSNSFAIDDPNAAYALDFGDLREMATVFVNGQNIGKVWSVPYKIDIPNGILQKGENKLEIFVDNLSFNRVIKLDIDGVKWRTFGDINFVDIQYKPFDASKSSPVESGIFGDVKLYKL